MDASVHPTQETAPDNAPAPSAPTLELSSLDAGLITSEEQLVVTGVVTDQDHDVSELTIQGESVAIDASGDFTTTIPLRPGLNTITAVARDQAGHFVDIQRAVFRGVFLEEAPVLPNAMVATIGLPAFEGIAEITEQELGKINFTKMLTAENPMVEDNGSPVPGKSLRWLQLSKVTVDEFVVDLVPQDGYLASKVTLKGVKIWGDAALGLGSDFPFSGEMEELVYTARINFTPPATLGELWISFTNEKTQAVGAIITSEYGETFLQKWMNGKTKFSQTIASAMNGTITTNLVQVFIQYRNSQQSYPFHETMTEVISTQVAQVAFTESGAEVSVQTQISSPEVKKYYAPEEPVPTNLPLASDTFWRAGVANNLFNQLLAVAWAAGGLDGLHPIPNSLKNTYPTATGVSLTFLLPPFVESGADGVPKLHIGELQMHVQGDGGPTLQAGLISGYFAIELQLQGYQRVLSASQAALSANHDGFGQAADFGNDWQKLSGIVAEAAQSAVNQELAKIRLPTVGDQDEIAMTSSPEYLFLLGTTPPFSPEGS